MATIRNLMNRLKHSRGGGGGRNAVPKRLTEEKRKDRKRKSEDETNMDEDGAASAMHAVERSGDPMPVGDVIESEEDGKRRYWSFQFDGRRFHLDDSVLVTPVEENAKPDVAIIKGISETLDGRVFVKVQWFYRPEELDTVDEDNWSSLDNRELLITNHQEEVLAETIMHNCRVHFLPDWKKLPDRRKHPGFVVLNFYDHLKQKVFKITDSGDFMGSLRKEIRLLLRETQLRIELKDSIAQ